MEISLEYKCETSIGVVTVGATLEYSINWVSTQVENEYLVIEEVTGHMGLCVRKFLKPSDFTQILRNGYSTSGKMDLYNHALNVIGDAEGEERFKQLSKLGHG